MKKIKHHGKNLERHLVNQLVKEIEKQGYPILVQKDQDSPARMFKSGYDFFVAENGKIIFVEAKRRKLVRYRAHNIEQLLNMLEEQQKLFAVQCSMAKISHFLCLFKILEPIPPHKLERIIVELHETFVYKEGGGVMRFDFKLKFLGSIEGAAEVFIGRVETGRAGEK